MSEKEVRAALKPSSDGLTLIITIGNALRKDDGVGPYIAEKIKQSLPENIALINAGDTPENCIDEAVGYNPKKVIFIDAGNFDVKPGTVSVIPEDAIPQNSLSTHSFPLPIVCGIIREDTGAEIVFIGIQIKDISFGEGICSEVKFGADKIIEIIEETINA